MQHLLIIGGQLVTWADHYLLSYEANERQANDNMRRMAQRDLAKQGRVGSEREIKNWLLERREKQIADRNKGSLSDNVNETASSKPS